MKKQFKRRSTAFSTNGAGGIEHTQATNELQPKLHTLHNNLTQNGS